MFLQVPGGISARLKSIKVQYMQGDAGKQSHMQRCSRGNKDIFLLQAHGSRGMLMQRQRLEVAPSRKKLQNYQAQKKTDWIAHIRPIRLISQVRTLD